MNLTLWIVTGFLAAAYLIGGLGKLIVSKERIAAFGAGAAWVEDFSAASVKGIGALEVLAAVGLVLPAALGIAPVLVPLAASGLAVIMIGAVWTRIRRDPLVARILRAPRARSHASAARAHLGPLAASSFGGDEIFDLRAVLHAEFLGIPCQDEADPPAAPGRCHASASSRSASRAKATIAPSRSSSSRSARRPGWVIRYTRLRPGVGTSSSQPDSRIRWMAS